MFPCYSKIQELGDYQMEYMARYISTSNVTVRNNSFHTVTKDKQSNTSDMSLNVSKKFTCYSDPEFREDRIEVFSVDMNAFQNVSSKHLDFCEEGVYS